MLKQNPQNKSENSVETRDIMLHNGNTLNVEIRPGFLDKVRRQFNLSASDPVSDDYIRVFFFSALKSAVEKAEQQT